MPIESSASSKVASLLGGSAWADPHSWPWWLWAEHGVLLGLLGWKAVELWRSSKACASKAQQQTQRAESPAALLDSLPKAALDAVERLKALAGPPEVLTAWAEVRAAPAASMDMDKVEEGQASAFRDARGAIYKFKLGPGVYVNMYYTKAGYRRSGDLHDANQYDIVLQGRTRLRMIDPHSGKEVVREYGANDFIVIPARTPHMFEFLEDNYLLEWWDAPFRAWYYRPYRDVIERGLPLSETDRVDFSLAALPYTPAA